MIIRAEQMKSHEAAAEEAFKQELVRHSQEFAPDLCASAGDANVRRAVEKGLNAASEYGFTLRGPLRFYIEMMLAFGSDVDVDPQFPWAAEELGSREIDDELLRADGLYRRMNEYCDRVLGPHNERALEALKMTAAASPADYNRCAGSFEGKVDLMLAEGFPQKREYIGDAGMQALIERSQAVALELEIAREADRAYLVVLMFAFGSGVFDDPLYHWMGGALRAERTLTVEQRMDRLQRQTQLYSSRVLQNRTKPAQGA